MRLSTIAGLTLGLALLPACKKKYTDVNFVPIAEAAARAAKFEPVLANIKKLPTTPPAVTRTFAPADAHVSTTSHAGREPTPEEYLLVHAEDLGAPGFYNATAVKVRINGTGVLSSCAKGTTEARTSKEEKVHKYALLPCTKFKYVYVIRETEYLQPKTRTVSDTTKDNKRTIIDDVIPGHVNADVTIYSAVDGKQVGAFQFRSVSSAAPSTEGGFLGAVDRDLEKQTNDAIVSALSAAIAGGAPAATTASAKPVVKAATKK